MSIDFKVIYNLAPNKIRIFFSYLFFILFAFAIILAIISFFIDNKLLGILFNICLYSSLGLIILLTIISLFKKQYKTIGVIKFDDNSIETEIEKTKYIYELEKIKDLQINYSNYKGQIILLPGTFYINKGDENIIEFEYENEKYKYNFLSTEFYDISYIEGILKIWNSRGINFTYKYKGKIKQLT